MKKIFLVLAILLIAINSFALGAFNTFNKRNHPELNWKVIESDHIEIIYHDPLINWAEKSLKIADASYKSLAKSYGTEPKSKIKIYISDQDDIANGATIFNSYFFIYVNQTEFLTNFSGTDNFLCKVIAHEMSHYFLYTTITDLAGKLLPPIHAFTFPKDINEGFAQYYSGEEWGVHRGDNSLRKAAFNGTLLDYNKDISGGLLYARGFSMLRYLDDFYGTEKLQQLLHYRNKAKLFIFKEAIKKTYGKSFKKLQQEWSQHILTEYYGEAYLLKNSIKSDSLFDYTFAQLKDISSDLKKVSSLKIKNNHALILEKKNKDQNYNNLIWAEISTDSLAKSKLFFTSEIEICKLGNAFNNDISYNGKFAIFCRYSRDENGSLLPTIYRFNSEIKEITTMFAGNFPQIFDNGDFIYKKRGNENSSIMKFSNYSSKKILSFPNEAQIEQLSISPDQQKFAFSILENNQFQVYVYLFERTQLISKYAFGSFPRKLNWIDSNNLLILSGDSEDYRTAITKINIANDQRTEFITPIYNIYPVTAKTDSIRLELLVLADIKENKTLGKLSLLPADKNFDYKRTTNHFDSWKEIITKNPIKVTEIDSLDNFEFKNYNSLKHIKYRMSLLLPIHSGFFAGILFSEPLGKHYLGGAIYQPYNFEDANYYYLNYTNNMFAPAITLSNLQIAYPGNYYEDKLYWQKINVTSLDFNFASDTITEQFWKLNYQLSLSYLDIDNFSDENDGLVDENSELILKTGYTFYPKFEVNLNYNLPYKSDDIHPVKMLNVNYSIAVSDEKIMMLDTFTQQEIIADFAWSPFFEMVNSSLIKTLSLQNHSNIHYETGESLGYYNFKEIQYQNEKLTISNFNPRLKNENTNFLKYGSAQNEIWAKISDDLNFSLKLGTDLISASYLGIGLWSDFWGYMDTNDEMDISNKTGYEIKSIISILGNPFTCRYGNSFEGDIEYFQATVPFALF